MDGGGFQQDEILEDVDAAAAVTNCISAMIDSGSVDSRRYFLVRRTVFEMLRDRGYAVPETEIEQTLDKFRTWWNPNQELERLTVSYTLASDLSKKIKVMFLGPQPVKIIVLEDIERRIKNDGLSRLILIIQSKISSQARNKTKRIFKFKVEIFQINDLLVNITKHVLKPKHIVLSPDEKREFLSTYQLQDSQLPRMLEKDAIARYYGLDKGTVLKVVHEGDLTGTHETYRCVF